MLNTVVSYFDLKKLKEDVQQDADLKELASKKNPKSELALLREFARINGYMALVPYIKSDEGAMYFKTLAEDQYSSSRRDNTYDQRLMLGISIELSQDNEAS